MTSIARIDADDLVNWARRRDAQDELPHLVRQLIQATTTTAKRVEFRTGAGVHLSGWDGATDVSEEHPYVPQGPAGWEMSVQNRVRQKADADYAARLEDSGDLVPSDSAFVFVTLRRWRDRNRWAREKASGGQFRDVKALDADDLHAWLELAPAVHLLLSKRLGKPVEDAEPLTEAWTRWSSATEYPLSPQLVLAGRELQAELLRERLGATATVTSVQADSQDEALAFIASAIHSLDDERRNAILARSVVVTSRHAAAILRASSPTLLLVAVGVDPGEAAAAVRTGHHVIVPLGREVPGLDDTIVLPRLRREPAKVALIEMGVPKAHVDDYATLARRSLTAFRRLLAAGPSVDRPLWARLEQVPRLVAALLAGSWDDSVEGDRDALSALADQPYDELERALQGLAAQSDPPLRRAGSRWFLVSRDDAWTLLSPYVTDADLRRLDVVASRVLQAPDPALELAPDERWLSALHGKARPHSGVLREGIAETLAQLAGHADRLRLVASSSGQHLAARIVHRLLTAANEDPDALLWMSCADVLPLLAEAAPEVFLDAVDAGTRDTNPILSKMYQDAEQRGFPFGSSAHTGLLWALEILAWSPSYLGRAALLLARLARLDPGGHWANRPNASLREIFLPWHPQTAASVEARNEVIDAIRRIEPAVAWKLMIALLPNTSDIGHNNASPRWRSWKPEEAATVNVREWAEVVDQLVTRLVEDAASDARRWGELIREADTIPSTAWSPLMQRLEGLNPQVFGDEDREEVRRGIRYVVSLHRTARADASWALPDEELGRLEAVYDKLLPEDIALRHRWLFDHDPQVPRGEDRDWRRHREHVDELRRGAAGQILNVAGPDAFVDLSRLVQDAFALGWAVGLLDDSEEFTEFIDLLVAEDVTLRQFASGFTAALMHRLGEEWMSGVVTSHGLDWSAEQRGAFLAIAPPTADVWEIAEADSQTAREYWTRVNEYRVDESQFIRAARALLEHGRPVAAAELLAHRPSLIADPDHVDLSLDALEQSAQVPISDSNDRAMRPYYVSQILTRLDAIEGASPERIARLEWLYLPLLDRSDRPPKLLHKTLANDPAFFVDVITLVYRAQDEEASEPTAADGNRARLAWELLHGWHSPPGAREDNTIDSGTLRDWVTSVRALASARNRVDVADSHIGQVLAYAEPDEDGSWPPLSVRDLLEETASDGMERGLQTATFNRRGVTSRSLTAGGTQERELANRYRRHAEAASHRWSRTASLLRAIAQSFEEWADREDIDAEYTEDTWR